MAATRANNLTMYPVTAKGNMMTFVPPDDSWWRPHHWEPNEPQLLRLRLQGATRNRYGAAFQWADSNGREWAMFTSDMVATLLRYEIHYGLVVGWFRVVKRGTHYGLSPCDEHPEEEYQCP